MRGTLAACLLLPQVRGILTWERNHGAVHLKTHCTQLKSATTALQGVTGSIYPAAWLPYNMDLGGKRASG